MNESRSSPLPAMLVPLLLGYVLGFAMVAAFDLNSHARDLRAALVQTVSRAG